MSYIPTYVYVTACVLVYLGARRCFPRTVRPERTLVFPLVFLALGATSLHRLFPDANVSAQAVAFATLACGAVLGWQQAGRWRIQFHLSPTGLKIRLPGDPSLLVTLLLSFFAEVVMHYALAVHASWSTNYSFIILSFAVWGALAGMPLGRSANLLTRAAYAKANGATPTLE
ncbi:hypothetical protein [Trinickia dinghuensis]|uniref:DUF1453 domain-containing protein n=1 Tax=Trinickia dinghuensis TaxID=2291023 RepID=A0A3D8K652_9BURK|nr:hypothetical protein [Trinickia dinghuensis]RDV00700.1 hypothetical protein DWV00_02815 [Trinickia dinghuensis]